jgi:two-component system, NarL family, sensor kinase
MLCGHLALLYIGIGSLRTNFTSVILYLVATGSVIIAGVYNIFAQSVGLLPSNDVNPLFIGILIEVGFLSSALILQYGKVQRDRSKLKNELVQQENKMFQQHIETIERERNRIALDLHDNIGSQLAHIKRSHFANDTEGNKRMETLIDEVRHLSHELAPTIAKVTGLMPLVEKLIVEARTNSAVDIKLQSFGFKEALKTESIVQVYRIIQEAIHNITSHSKARHAHIQFFGYEDKLNITIEDDGVGFDVAAKSGFGINSMKARVSLLNGRIEINSRPSHGCMIMIEVPIGEANSSGI